MHNLNIILHIFFLTDYLSHKVDFLENKVWDEKFLFYIFEFFFRIESSPFRLYHQFPTTLYILLITAKIIESSKPIICILQLIKNNLCTRVFALSRWRLWKHKLEQMCAGSHLSSSYSLGKKIENVICSTCKGSYLQGLHSKKKATKILFSPIRTRGIPN